MNATLEKPRTTTPVRSVIGRSVMVRDHRGSDRVFVGALVIDAVAGENRAKRIRLQTGSNAGEVRMPGEYDVMEFVD